MQRRSRQDQICIRLKEVREDILDISLSGFAKEVGIPKERLASYEQCRAPLRVDLALRICRRFVISEEWLSTGKFLAYEDAAKRRHISVLPPHLHSIAKRHCVDLWSEPEWKHAPPGALFSDVWDEILSTKYRDLVQTHFYAPRVVFSDAPEPKLAAYLVSAYAELWLKVIAIDSQSRKESEWANQRQFVADLLRSGVRLIPSFLGLSINRAPRETKEAVVNE